MGLEIGIHKLFLKKHDSGIIAALYDSEYFLRSLVLDKKLRRAGEDRNIFISVFKVCSLASDLTRRIDDIVFLINSDKEFCNRFARIEANLRDKSKFEYVLLADMVRKRLSAKDLESETVSQVPSSELRDECKVFLSFV